MFFSSGYPPAWQRCPKKIKYLGIMGSLTLTTVLMTQHPAFAQAVVPNTSNQTIPIVFIIFGLLASSFLIIESRRIIPFLLGLLSMSVGFVIVLLLAQHYTSSPLLEHFGLPTAIGFGLGLLFTGLWWWGVHQGYAQALFQLCMGKHDPLLAKLIQQPSDTKLSIGFYKKLTLQAIAIRYRHMLRRGDANTLYTLIHKKLQADWHKEINDQKRQNRQRKQEQIETLLDQADFLCMNTEPHSGKTS